MVYKKNGLKKILDEFIKRIQKKISIQKIILFGSYAYGRHNPFSDIDIAVISPSFNGMNEFERIRLLLDCVHEIKYELPTDIEPFGYTPEEYERASPFDFAGSIKKTGKIIYS